MLNFLNKKSQAEYNWIFIIVAGSIILAFFVMFIVKYTDLQMKKENAELTSSVYNQIYSLQKSSHKIETNIPLYGKKEVFVSCDKFMIGNFESKSISNEFIFAPLNMETEKVQLFMRTWDYPFRIANFFYLTSNDTKYYLVYNSETEEYVKSLDFPKNFNIEITSSRPSSGKVIYFMNNNEGISVDINNQKVSINGQVYPYFGEAMLYGAIFGENYPCLLEKSLDKYKQIIEIYEKKAEIMFLLDSSCNYDLIKTELAKLKKAVSDRNYERIKEHSKSVEEQNQNIIGGDCKALF